jgi:hypothetical protein
MAFSTYGKLMKCLHTDSKPSDAERSEACGLLGQWKHGPGTPPRLRRIAEHRRDRFQLARRRWAAPWSCDKMSHIPRRTRANEAELLIA